MWCQRSSVLFVWFHFALLNPAGASRCSPTTLRPAHLFPYGILNGLEAVSRIKDCQWRETKTRKNIFGGLGWGAWRRAIRKRQTMPQECIIQTGGQEEMWSKGPMVLWRETGIMWETVAKKRHGSQHGDRKITCTTRQEIRNGYMRY